MRAPGSGRIRSLAACPLAFLALAWIASACASPAATPEAPVESPAAFTITDDVRVGSSTRADFERAVRMLEEERFEIGIALLVDVTQAAPELTAAHIDLGIAYARVGDLERAEASLGRALELEPTHPVAQNELGMVQRRTGRFQEARESYENALAVYPGFHFARKNLGILCDLYLADADCALESYERYAQAVPDDETAAMWIADLRNRSAR